MQIAVAFIRHIVVHDNINMIDINSSAENVSGDHDSALEFLEVLVASGSIYQNILLSKIERSQYRSSWVRSRWMATEGKLHSTKSLLSSIARATVRTKMIIWLNTRASISSFSFLFFSRSCSCTKYCFSPWRVSLASWSIIISNG